jgi:hypothetical protein
MIHTYACLSNKENIYKIGRSNNLYNRITSYSNGSICHLVIESMESKEDESEMLKIFNNKYKNIKFYGNEYFEGDKVDMIITMKKYIYEKYNKPRIISKSFVLLTYNKKDNLYINANKRKINKLFLLDKYKISMISHKDDKQLNIDETNNNIDDSIDDELEGEEELESEPDDSETLSDNESTSKNENLIKIIEDNKIFYICTVCCKTFISPSHLKRHTNKKNGCKKPVIDFLKFNDDECFLNSFKHYIKLSLKTNDSKKLILKSLQSLIEDELNIILESEIFPKRIFKCNDCNQEFSHRQGLHKHNKLNRCKAKQKQSIEQSHE